MDFRKKPVVIQAMQWDGSWDSMDTINAHWPELNTTHLDSHPPSRTVRHWGIGTLEGYHEVSKGDYIIKGVKGEFYPCKPDIFALTYDPASQWSIDQETYVCQMAGISTAATGYWTEKDFVHPDYDTLALRDVAKLYQKYDKLFTTISTVITELSQKGMGMPPSVTRAKKMLQDAIDPFKDHEQKQETAQEVRTKTESGEPSKLGAGGHQTHGTKGGLQSEDAEPSSPSRPDPWAGD